MNKVLFYTGSIPEQDGEQFYNTCAVFGPQGKFLGKYRKVSSYWKDIIMQVLSFVGQMHLFDIDIPGKIKFKESDILANGSELLIIDTGTCISAFI